MFAKNLGRYSQKREKMKIDLWTIRQIDKQIKREKDVDVDDDVDESVVVDVVVVVVVMEVVSLLEKVNTNTTLDESSGIAFFSIA